MVACIFGTTGSALSMRSKQLWLSPSCWVHIPRMSATQSRGRLPPSPREACHPIQGKAATQSRGKLPPSPREACHVDQGNVATHSRQSLPPSEQRDAGCLLLV